jgi:DNA-directed RNA polymerase specialized sigma24 family protein
MTDQERDSAEEALALYRRLWNADLDEVHELIARHGPAILTRGRPYLLTAARRSTVSRWRRERRRTELERQADSLRTVGPEAADPAVLVEKRQDLAALREALDRLPDSWLLVVWRRAEGSSYAEIATEWAELGFGSLPSVESLRQIQHRAISQLQRELGVRPPRNLGSPDAG